MHLITSLRFGIWQMTLAAHIRSVLDLYCLNFLTLFKLKKPLNTFTRLCFWNNQQHFLMVRNQDVQSCVF